jgi:hypothetical protein
MDEIRKQRLPRELAGGEAREAPSAACFLVLAGIGMMLFALFFPGAGS